MKTRSLTIGNIKHEIRANAAHIAAQYSALWSDMVGNLLSRIERACGDRMSDQVWDEMHDYGMEQVRKLGLPSGVSK
jgi:putative heme iron utilization protein